MQNLKCVVRPLLCFYIIVLATKRITLFTFFKYLKYFLSYGQICVFFHWKTAPMLDNGVFSDILGHFGVQIPVVLNFEGMPIFPQMSPKECAPCIL